MCARIAHGWMVLQHSFPHCKWSRAKCFKILLFASCFLFLSLTGIFYFFFKYIALDFTVQWNPICKVQFTLWYTNQTVLHFCSRSFSKTIPIEAEQVRITIKWSVFLQKVNVFFVPSREHLYMHLLLA